jgi:hypothetical protein
MFHQLVDRIKKTVVLCFNPQEFAEVANTTATKTFKSIESVNKKVIKKVKKSIDWNWKNLKQFVLTVCLTVVSIVIGIPRSGILVVLSSFTTTFLITASPLLILASYLGGFLISAFLGGCLILVGLIHGIFYPVTALYKTGAFVVKVYQANIPARKSEQTQSNVSTEQPAAASNHIILMLPSNLNDEKVWTHAKLVEFCHAINAAYPGSISNHDHPQIKRRVLIRKIKDFFKQLDQLKKELFNQLNQLNKEAELF